MCGIFGAIGASDAPAKTLKKLKQLEYRGYDSWGIASLVNGRFDIQKQTGQIKIEPKQLQVKDSLLSIGHTRWATHGGVTTANAHPQFNKDKTLVCIHNGIIENYQELKQQLDSEVVLESETDTEVFVHLVDKLLKQHNLCEAVRLAFKQIQGESAFVIAHSPTQEVVAVKKGSPLIVGLAENGCYLASDVQVLLEYTRQVVFLEDGQMVRLRNDQAHFFEVESDDEFEPHIETINWQIETNELQDYSSYLEKEIHDQPECLERIRTEFREPVKKLAKLIEAHDKIYLVGCGTAYHAALTSSYLLSEIAEVEAQAAAGSEFSYKQKFCDDKTLVVFFSQSGETMDVIKPLKALKEKGVATAGIVNTFGSSLYRLADFKIWLKAGPELSVLSSKAFTAKVGLMLLAAHKLAQSSAQAVNDNFKAAVADIKQLLSADFSRRYLEPAAALLLEQEHIFGIGRGISYPLILEGALKIKEVTYKHMEGLAGGELKHGVIALIEKGIPCFAIAPSDNELSLTLSGATEIKSRGGYIIGLAPENNEVFDHFIPVPDRGHFSSLTNAVVMQIIALKMAESLGRDPDKPRNLAKSVTVV